MDFTLTVEQEMLRDSARQFIASELSFDSRRRALAVAQPGDTWARFAELGWLAMPVPEDADGLDSSTADLVLMCEEMGRGLCVEPFVACAVLPAGLLAAGDRADVRNVLADLATGQHRVAVAAYEEGQRYDVQRPQTTAVRQPDGSYLLDGAKILVSGGAEAHALVVIAKCERKEGGDPELAVVLVAADAPGVTRRHYRGLDSIEMADVRFEGVMLAADAMLVSGQPAIDAVDRAFDEAAVCQCADAVGAMSRALELTVEYLHVRRQFGKALSEFQALQHAVAELFIDVSDAKSMLYQAVAALAGPARARRKAVSGCMVKVMSAAKEVTGMAVHLHGGIGMTDEYPVGHYLRRVMVSERLHGDHEHHLQRYLSALDA
jgi:alkylation response protein AidB-like acyl-CoA dehydrogenase